MSEPKPTYTVKKTTIAVYPADVQRLDAIRRSIQAQRLADCTQADALAYLLDGYTQMQAWVQERSKE